MKRRHSESMKVVHAVEYMSYEICQIFLFFYKTYSSQQGPCNGSGIQTTWNWTSVNVCFLFLKLFVGRFWNVLVDCFGIKRQHNQCTPLLWSGTIFASHSAVVSLSLTGPLAFFRHPKWKRWQRHLGCKMVLDRVYQPETKPWFIPENTSAEGNVFMFFKQIRY